MRVSCIILARGGSKGIPNKNLIDFCGKPLLFWTINQAKASTLIDDVWLSSDCDHILSVGEELGVNTIVRPNNLASDSSRSEDGWKHALKHIIGLSNTEIDYIVAPQVTSPLRDALDFDKGIRRLIKTGKGSLLSVCKIEDYFCWEFNNNNNPISVSYDYRNRKPRQEIKEKYLENGSFYIFKPEIIQKYDNRLGGCIDFFIMEKYKQFQIDEFVDIEICEAIMKKFGLNKL